MVVRETGSHELIEQRDHMVEGGRAIGGRKRGRVNHYGSASRIL